MYKNTLLVKIYGKWQNMEESHQKNTFKKDELRNLGVVDAYCLAARRCCCVNLTYDNKFDFIPTLKFELKF